MLHFPRVALTTHTVDMLLGREVLGDAHNGLFLAAPRRTGKSTFLQADLMPALQQAGVVVVYVDLWSDIRRDPAALVAEAIGRELITRSGAVGKAARAAGLESVTIAGAPKIDTTRIGRTDGLTLPDAVRELQERAKAPVALIIDEAQHALSSVAGEATMAALKSARDQMNRADSVKLLLIMSGSDRDKLLRLVNSNAAPFYGSQVERLPPLGADFMAFVVERIAAQRPELTPIDTAMLLRALEIFGNRPQFFMHALADALSPLAGPPGPFEQIVLATAVQRRVDDEAQIAAEFSALNALERAVIWRLLEQGPRFRPYDAEALRFYRDKSGLPATPAKVQAALEALRARTPAMVWKSARGEYAVEDAAMHRWFADRVAAGTWPPVLGSGGALSDTDSQSRCEVTRSC